MCIGSAQSSDACVHHTHRVFRHIHRSATYGHTLDSVAERLAARTSLGAIRHHASLRPGGGDTALTTQRRTRGSVIAALYLPTRAEVCDITVKLLDGDLFHPNAHRWLGVIQLLIQSGSHLAAAPCDGRRISLRLDTTLLLERTLVICHGTRRYTGYGIDIRVIIEVCQLHGLANFLQARVPRIPRHPPHCGLLNRELYLAIREHLIKFRHKFYSGVIFAASDMMRLLLRHKVAQPELAKDLDQLEPVILLGACCIAIIITVHTYIPGIVS